MSRTFAILLAATAILSGCSTPDSSPQSSTPATSEAPTDATPAVAPDAFVNRVWVVAESEQVAAGALRVFLSDGTLVMSSPTSTPLLGTWSYTDGRLRITEEGLEYEVDILELTGDTFRIRIHSPGEPVEIRFTAAA
jgi:hypothetical protein